MRRHQLLLSSTYSNLRTRDLSTSLTKNVSKFICFIYNFCFIMRERFVTLNLNFFQAPSINCYWMEFQGTQSLLELNGGGRGMGKRAVVGVMGT